MTVRLWIGGKPHKYASLEEAKKDMLEGMMMSEGSERDRYTELYTYMMAYPNRREFTDGIPPRIVVGDE
jgi:hypothetical protein